MPIEPLSEREEELLALQERVAQLEDRVARLIGALVAKGVVGAGESCEAGPPPSMKA